MAWLLFAVFIVVPLLEIFAFIEVGSAIGALPTLALIVLTAVVGALLVRWQGLKVAMEARQSMARDEPPVAAVVHGVLLLLAGLLLVTPGFVTDTAGFLLLVPGLRSLLVKRILGWLVVRTRTRRPDRRRPTVIEGEAIEVDTDGDLPGQGRERSPWRPRDGTTR